MRKWIFLLLAAALVVGGANAGDDEEAAPTSDLAAAPRTSTSAAASPQADETDLIVTKVVDGDTFDLSDGRRVRVLGVDAPEKGECGYEEARDFARARLLDEEVAVASDPTQDPEDRYGRSLLYVSRWGVDYSHAIVVAGLATATVSATNPVEKAKTLQMAEDAARTLKLGIWGELCAPSPPPTTTRTTPPRQTPNDDVVAAPQPPVPSAEVGSDASRAPAPSRTGSPRSPSPVPEPPREPASGCHPSYEPCVPVSPNDLDCRDIGHRVKVVGPDEYRLDGDDNDGKGCERFPPK